MKIEVVDGVVKVSPETVEDLGALLNLVRDSGKEVKISEPAVEEDEEDDVKGFLPTCRVCGKTITKGGKRRVLCGSKECQKAEWRRVSREWAQKQKIKSQKEK